MKTVHILNGDSLKVQLKSWMKGEFIVARECLIDGNIQGDTLTNFYANRAKFIAEYDGFEEKDYYVNTVPEMDKIITIKQNCELVCWFEDDLFCQTNFWFVTYLLVTYTKLEDFFLVRPNKGNEYCFARMNKKELTEAFENRQLLDSKQTVLLAQLWPLYQQKNYQQMLNIAEKLNNIMPCLIPVIEAQQRRTPDDNGLGYPERQLLKIMKALDTTDFPTVFKRFSAQEGVYSFGDLQVKKMFDKLIKRS